MRPGICLCLLLSSLIAHSEGGIFEQAVSPGYVKHLTYVVKSFAIALFTASALTEAEVAPFVTPGFPACYVSVSQYENVPGVTRLCPQQYSSQRTDCSGQGYYFYCSEEHECCFFDGCLACCTKRDKLNTAEVAGVVITCVFVAGFALGISYFVVGRFFTKRVATS